MGSQVARRIWWAPDGSWDAQGIWQGSGRCWDLLGINWVLGRRQVALGLIDGEEAQELAEMG